MVLAASVALFIVIGGGAALWSLLREIYATPPAEVQLDGRLGDSAPAPLAGSSPTPGSASSDAPQPPADPAARR